MSDSDKELFEAVAREAEESAKARPQVTEHLRPAESYIPSLVAAQKAERLPTGFPTFDAACRGGLPFPRLVIVGGAPGACKTTCAAFLGYSWSLREGYFVAFLSVDEGPEGIVARLVQLAGHDPDGELDAARAALALLPIWLCSGAPVEAFAAEAHHRAAGRKVILIVDSIQTVSAGGSQEADGPRERVAAVVAALKEAARTAMVLATCELARGSYRSKSSAEQINDLAAFKESGDIEYAAETALVLRSEPGESDLVSITTPKNRGAKMGKPSWTVRLNRVDASLAEVDAASVEPAESNFDRAKSNVLRLIASDRDIRSVNEIARRLTAARKGSARTTVLNAVTELSERRIIAMYGGVYRLTSEMSEAVPDASQARESGSVGSEPVRNHLPESTPVQRFRGSPPFRGEPQPEPVRGTLSEAELSATPRLPDGAVRYPLCPHCGARHEGGARCDGSSVALQPNPTRRSRKGRAKVAPPGLPEATGDTGQGCAAAAPTAQGYSRARART